MEWRVGREDEKGRDAKAFPLFLPFPFPFLPILRSLPSLPLLRSLPPLPFPFYCSLLSLSPSPPFLPFPFSVPFLSFPVPFHSSSSFLHSVPSSSPLCLFRFLRSFPESFLDERVIPGNVSVGCSGSVPVLAAP